MTGMERVWRPGRPVPVHTILGPLRRGAGDPTYVRDGESIWRSVRTPEGPATWHLRCRPDLGEVSVIAWGDGAAWALDRVPRMLGEADDPSGFETTHPVLARAQARHRHWRVPATGLVLEALVAACLEQKVTGREAWTGWRRLLHRFGEPAPRPEHAPLLRVLPTAARLVTIPSWEWLSLPVDNARSRAVVGAARVAAALERTAAMSGPDADAALRSLPGIGRWTAAEVRQRAHGDADAVSFGDYHLASSVGTALVGEAVDDDQMAELLEKYRPHRYRVQRLVELSGIASARRGPRMAPRRHVPGSVR